MSSIKEDKQFRNGVSSKKTPLYTIRARHTATCNALAQAPGPPGHPRRPAK